MTLESMSYNKTVDKQSTQMAVGSFYRAGSGQRRERFKLARYSYEDGKEGPARRT